jgi:hypothetical protein
VMMQLIEPAAFVMTRKMLLGIKERAEARVGKQSEFNPIYQNYTNKQN